MNSGEQAKQQNQSRESEIEKIVSDLYGSVHQLNISKWRRIIEDTDLLSVYSVNSIEGYSSNYKFPQMMEASRSIEDNYSIWIGIRGDGNCFYRSVIILYLLQLFEADSISKLDNFICDVNNLKDIKSDNAYLSDINCEQLKQIFLVFLLKFRDMKINGQIDNIMKIIDEYNSLPELDFAAVVITRFMIYDTFLKNKSHPTFKLFIEEQMSEKIPQILLKYYEYAEDIIIPLAAQTFSVELVVQNLYRQSDKGPINTERLFYQPFNINSEIQYPKINVLFTKGHYEGLFSNEEVINNPRYYDYYRQYSPCSIQLFIYYSNVIRELYLKQKYSKLSPASTQYLQVSPSVNGNGLSNSFQNSKIMTRDTSFNSKQLNDNERETFETPTKDNINVSHILSGSSNKHSALLQTSENGKIEKDPLIQPPQVSEFTENEIQTDKNEVINEKDKVEEIEKNEKTDSLNQSNTKQNSQEEQVESQIEKKSTNIEIKSQEQSTCVNQSDISQLNQEKTEQESIKSQENINRDQQTPNENNNQTLNKSKISQSNGSQNKTTKIQEDTSNKTPLLQCYKCHSFSNEFINFVEKRSGQSSLCFSCIKLYLTRFYTTSGWFSLDSKIIDLDKENSQKLIQFIRNEMKYKQFADKIDIIREESFNDVEKYKQNGSNNNSKNNQLNAQNRDSNLNSRSQFNYINNPLLTTNQEDEGKVNKPHPSITSAKEDSFQTPQRSKVDNLKNISQSDSRTTQFSNNSYSGQSTYLGLQNSTQNDNIDIKNQCLYCTQFLDGIKHLIYGTSDHGYLCQNCLEDILSQDSGSNLIMINGKIYECSDNIKQQKQQFNQFQPFNRTAATGDSPQKSRQQDNQQNSGVNKNDKTLSNSNEVKDERRNFSENQTTPKDNQVNNTSKNKEEDLEEVEEESKFPEEIQQAQSRGQSNQSKPIFNNNNNNTMNDQGCENCKSVSSNNKVTLVLEEGKEEVVSRYCDECLITKFIFDFNVGQELVFVDDQLYRLDPLSQIKLKFEKEQQQGQLFEKEDTSARNQAVCIACKQLFVKEYQSSKLCKQCKISSSSSSNSSSSQKRAASCNSTAVQYQKNQINTSNNDSKENGRNIYQKYQIQNNFENNQADHSTSTNNKNSLNSILSKQTYQEQEKKTPYQPKYNNFINQDTKYKINNDVNPKQTVDEDHKFQTPEKKPMELDHTPSYRKTNDSQGRIYDQKTRSTQFETKLNICRSCHKQVTEPLLYEKCQDCRIQEIRKGYTQQSQSIQQSVNPQTRKDKCPVCKEGYQLSNDVCYTCKYKYKDSNNNPNKYSQKYTINNSERTSSSSYMDKPLQNSGGRSYLPSQNTIGSSTSYQQRLVYSKPNLY